MSEIKSKFDEYTIEQRKEDLINCMKTQCSKGNYDYSEYMLGMANGLILANHIINEEYGSECKYLEMPKKTKPLSEMTLKEVKEMCKKHDCSDCILDRKICFIDPLKIPKEWELEENERKNI